MISEPQTFWKSPNWTFLLHDFFFFTFSFAWISSLGIFPCMNFFLVFSPPPHPHHFSNGPSLKITKGPKRQACFLPEVVGGARNTSLRGVTTAAKVSLKFSWLFYLSSSSEECCHRKYYSIAKHFWQFLASRSGSRIWPEVGLNYWRMFDEEGKRWLKMTTTMAVKVLLEVYQVPLLFTKWTLIWLNYFSLQLFVLYIWYNLEKPRRELRLQESHESPCYSGTFVGIGPL